MGGVDGGDMKKRILVTGGAGFIGSNLCKRLLADERNHVICLDNLHTGRIGNIEPFMSMQNFEFVEHDVQDFADIPCEQIYNAACPASPKVYQKYPVATTRTCVLGMLNMLELARRYDATILQFSTSEVYGDPEVHPQVEEYRGFVNPIGTRSCYDEGKRCAESLCFDYNREFGTKIKVVRIFNTYGPNMDPEDGRVVSNFIMQALKNEAVTIYGDGSQTRSFQYIDDLLEGIYRMMNTSRQDFLGPVNLGNERELTINELAALILKITGSKSRLVYESLPADDPVRRRADTKLAFKELQGWTSNVPPEKGLESTIRYFKEFITL